MITIPLLSELGFEKFSSSEWRENQAEALDKALNSPHKFVIAQAPTGFGKSPFAMGLGKLVEPKHDRMYQKDILDPQSAVLTGTKQLQAQYLGDFSDWARQVRGRANFTCLTEPSVTAAHAACTINNPKTCPSYNQCPYYVQRAKALFDSEMTIHSYAYFLNAANYSHAFTGQSCLVLDEAHLLDDMLMSFVTSPVLTATCRMFDIAYPPQKEGWNWAGWKGWAEVYRDELAEQVRALKGPALANVQTRRKYSSGNALLKTIELLDKADADKPWVCVPTQGGWDFMPTWVDKLADDLLYRHGHKVVLMSATILDYRTFAMTVGIDPNNCTFLDIPSSFPVGNKPVYYEPAMNVKAGQDLTPVCEAVYGIIRDHEGDKGLVHCVSYAVMDAIVKGAPPDVRERLMWHATSDRLEKYEEFRRRTDNPVLLSPSMKEGVSLEGDMCRFIIIAKMPYPYLGSPQIKARMQTALGQKWYAWKTMCDVIQMSGRGMRSAEDYCAVYILDGNFKRLFQQMRWCLPSYWLAELRDPQGLL